MNVRAKSQNEREKRRESEMKRERVCFAKRI